MKYRDYVKQEIAVIKDRDPAIKSDKEVCREILPVFQRFGKTC